MRLKSKGTTTIAAAAAIAVKGVLISMNLVHWSLRTNYPIFSNSCVNKITLSIKKVERRKRYAYGCRNVSKSHRRKK